LYGAHREEQNRVSPKTTEDGRELEDRNALVFAIGHEIGNFLGALRLQAHLLDDELGPRALAEASVTIDSLAGRATPLLALLRPILSPGPRGASPAGSGGMGWAGVLARIRRELEDEGTRGVAVEIEDSAANQLSGPDADWLHSLLMALLGATLEHVAPRGTIHLRLQHREREVALVVEDDGEGEDLSSTAPRRGRPLIVEIARLLLAGIGGRVETSRVGDQSHVELIFQAPPGVDAGTASSR
jgi:signal transduction histidine kinase